MDILFLVVVIVATIYGFARFVRWALVEDRKERDKRIVDELEQWLKE